MNCIEGRAPPSVIYNSRKRIPKIVYVRVNMAVVYRMHRAVADRQVRDCSRVPRRVSGIWDPANSTIENLKKQGKMGFQIFGQQDVQIHSLGFGGTAYH